MHSILFLPQNKKIQVNTGCSVLQAALKAEIILNAACDGKGTCGTCKVIVKDGIFCEITPKEQSLLTPFEIEHHYRLACCLTVTADCTIEIPNLHGNSKRKKQLTYLPSNFCPDCSNKNYGLALDLGTTTIVAMLWDFKKNKLIDSVAKTNLQSLHGADVISRIQFCTEAKIHTKLMQQQVLSCVNKMILEMTKAHAVLPEKIDMVTVVGNTTMSHLFLGINPKSLAKAPFTPAFQGEKDLLAHELGLCINQNAHVYVLPNIGCHVGSDLTAVMLATDLFHKKGNTIVIDIGTNGEILAASDGDVKACSTAAGPAFEGACIQCGIRAAKGAIEGVKITDDVSLSIIESDLPVGICGSGLIDAVAELLKAKILTENGNFISKEEAIEKKLSANLVHRLYGSGKDAGFLLYEDKKDPDCNIVITQQDIREIQLAKAAIAGGIFTLMKKCHMTIETVDEMIIAGAFGNFIKKQSAVCIGLLPNVPLNKIHCIGNGAGTGCLMALLSKGIRDCAKKDAKKIEHVELSEDLDFQDYYIENMLFEVPVLSTSSDFSPR